MRVYWWDTGLHFKPESKEDKDFLLACAEAVRVLEWRYQPLGTGVEGISASDGNDKNAVSSRGVIVHK